MKIKNMFLISMVFFTWINTAKADPVQQYGDRPFYNEAVRFGNELRNEPYSDDPYYGESVKVMMDTSRIVQFYCRSPKHRFTLLGRNDSAYSDGAFGNPNSQLVAVVKTDDGLEKVVVETFYNENDYGSKDCIDGADLLTDRVVQAIHEGKKLIIQNVSELNELITVSSL